MAEFPLFRTLFAADMFAAMVSHRICADDPLRKAYFAVEMQGQGVT